MAKDKKEKVAAPQKAKKEGVVVAEIPLAFGGKIYGVGEVLPVEKLGTEKVDSFIKKGLAKVK